jgi:hypothetical protein
MVDAPRRRMGVAAVFNPPVFVAAPLVGEAKATSRRCCRPATF